MVFRSIVIIISTMSNQAYHWWITTLFAQIMIGVSIWLIRVYQITLSPDKGVLSPRLRGRVCTHEPHCSEYTIQALKRYGLIKWWMMGLERISRCTPKRHTVYDPVSYRVVFFSSAPIGVPFLQALAQNASFDLAGVVTMPDQPSGRGMKMQANIIKQTTQDWNTQHDTDIPIYTPARIRPDKSDEGAAFMKHLKDLDADYFVVIAYGKILPQSLLDLPRIAPINVHGSILPAYRWASPLQSIFLDDLHETGITIMRMTAGCDEWPIVKIVRFPVAWDWTVLDLIDKIKQSWPRHLITSLVDYAHGRLVDKSQEESLASMCRKFVKEDGLIDPFVDSIELIRNTYRAFALWPKLYRIHEDKRIIIESLRFDQTSYSNNKSSPMIDRHGQINPTIISWTVKPESSKSQDLQQRWSWQKKSS